MTSRRSRSAGSSTAWWCWMPRAASSATPCCGTTPAPPTRHGSSPRSSPTSCERTGSLPVASFTATKLRWLRDAEPENAARVAAVALPHDWLTWRLRGFGPDNPDLTELITDRSDASGTSYWGADRLRRRHPPRRPRRDKCRRLRTRAPARARTVRLGRISCIWPSDMRGRGGGGGQCGGGARARRGVGGCGGVDRHERHGVRRDRRADPRRDRHGRRVRGCERPLAPAGRNAQRGARARCDRRAPRRRPRRARPARARRPSPAPDGLVLQPYFEGERTPNLPDATATLFGMTLASTTRANLARAAIEGMLCGLADGLDALPRERRRRPPHPADRRRRAEPGGLDDRGPGVRRAGGGARARRVRGARRRDPGRLGAHRRAPRPGTARSPPSPRPTTARSSASSTPPAPETPEGPADESTGPPVVLWTEPTA